MVVAGSNGGGGFHGGGGFQVEADSMVEVGSTAVVEAGSMEAVAVHGGGTGNR